MSAYLLIFLFLLSFSFCILDKVKKAFTLKKVIFIGFIVSLIIISSLKNEQTSSDTQNYIKYYEKVTPIKDFSYADFNVEPGFAILNSLCKQFTDNPLLLFSIISLISIGVYGILIWKYSPYPFLSIFIYFSWFYLTREIIIIRYGISSAIMLLSIICLSENQIKKSVFWGIIASLFHYTALTYVLVLGIWIFFSKTQKIKAMETFLIFSFSIAVAGISIMKIAILVHSAAILPPYFQIAMSRGMLYLKIQETRTLRTTLMYLPMFFFYRKCIKDYFIKNIYFIFLVSFFLLFELIDAAELSRIPMMYMTVILLFLPMMLSKIKRNYYSILYLYVMILVVYNFIRASFLNSGGSILKF